MRCHLSRHAQELRGSDHCKLKKKAKWLSGEALQIAVKRREVKRKGEKERYIYSFECRVPKNSKER